MKPAPLPSPPSFVRMRTAIRKIAVIVSCILVFAICLSLSLLLTSDWRAHRFATLEASADSPDGCFRMDAMRPAFMTAFNEQPMPEAPGEVERRWIHPRFYRVTDRRDGHVVGTSPVIDARHGPFQIDWFAASNPRYREIWLAGSLVVSTRRCSDSITRMAVGEVRGQI